MNRSRILTGILGAAFCLAFVSSVRADSLHPNILLEKLIFAERHNLTLFDDTQSAETGYLYAGHFENNNGKHLGFSMTSVNRGPILGIVRPPAVEVSQNPEPTAMVLLGTGLAAVGAFARKINRRRRT